LLLNEHFLRREKRVKTPPKIYQIIHPITVVSSGRRERGGISSFAGMKLARKSQGFGKICGETFFDYFKLFPALETGAIHLSARTTQYRLLITDL